MPSEATVPTNPGQRLHPSSPIFIVWNSIQSLVIPGLIALYTQNLDWETAALGVVALASVFSIIQYRFYRYWLQSDAIVIKQGVFFRKLRNVPYERIQNVQITQTPLHRILGVANLQLESASGTEPEALMRVVSLKKAATIRSHILNTERDDADQPSQEDDPPLFTMGTADILRCGLIQWRGPAVLGAGLGGAIYTDVISFDYLKSLAGSVGAYLGTLDWGVWLLVPLLLWLISTLQAWLKYHKLTLRLNEQKMALSSGLLTKVQASLPTYRVQLLRVRESPMHRLLNRISIMAENAGGTHQEREDTLHMLAPLLVTDDKRHFLEQIQDDVYWDQINWQPVAARAWRRVAKRHGLLLALVMTALGVWLAHPLVLLGLLLAIPIPWYARRYIACLGFHLSDELIGFRCGVWFKTEIYVRLGKVQTVTTRQNPFDRHHNMATLVVDTAGARHGARRLKVPFLELELAADIREKIARRVGASEFRW